MILPLIAAVLFLGGAVCNIFSGDFADAVFGLVIATGFVLLCYYMFIQETRRADFLDWLQEFGSEILEDPLQTFYYNGNAFSSFSYVTQYVYCTSFLFGTLSDHTYFFPEGSSRCLGGALLASVITVVFGWWGLPWGPSFTVHALYKNMRGGESMMIRDLLEKIAADKRVLREKLQAKSSSLFP